MAVLIMPAGLAAGRPTPGGIPPAPTPGGIIPTPGGGPLVIPTPGGGCIRGADRTRVSLQPQHGLSIGIAAVGHRSPEACCAAARCREAMSESAAARAADETAILSRGEDWWALP